MDSSILKKAGKYLSERKWRRRYKGWICALTAVVALGVLFVLAMPASTLEKEAYCGMEEHAHSDECYEKALICGYEDAEASAANQENPSETQTGAEIHVHNDSCYTETKTLICGNEETEGHLHEDGCYTVTESKELTCSEEESEEHTHGDSCYTVTEIKELSCGQEEGAGAHWHADECYEVSKELTCGMEENSAADGNPSGGTEPEEGTQGEPHVHTEDCYELKEICGKEEHEHTQECYDETFSCGLREHIHDSGCYDENGQMACSLPEHTHLQRCRMTVFCQTSHEHEYGCYIGPEVSEEYRERIIRVDEMIDELPSYEEIEAKLAGFDDAGDLDGYESYFMEISFQAGTAYAHYEDLNDVEDLRQYVVNSEELMMLSSLWEAMALDAADEDTVWIYSVNHMGSVNRAALVWGKNGTVQSNAGADFAWWAALVAEKDGKGFRITKIIPAGSGTGEEKKSIALTENRIVIFLYNRAVDAAEEGRYIRVGFDYTKYVTGFDAKGYGPITFSLEKEPEGKEKPAVNNNLSPVANPTETKDLIEINLYDYNSRVNDLFKSDRSKYPGFQQSGGAKDPLDLYGKWGSGYNFGDNIITDRETGVESLNAGNVPNSINGSVNGANSGMYGANSPMNKKLSSDGYPVLKNGVKLDYLFSDSDCASKMNQPGLDGLFQYNAETGAYYFDSRKNHAEFNGGNQFLLYNELLSPNAIMYPFGNFMPFNKINTESTLTSKMDRDYFDNMSSYCYYRGMKNELNLGKRYQDLGGYLGGFVERMDDETKGQSWNAETAMRKYFEATGYHLDETCISQAMQKVYSIDYDVPKNFFFGMTLEMNYVQPKNGMTGPDGKQEMIFEFAGDDDVWVYIDGNLFLDLSGIHRHVGGTIDFVRGTVTYYNFDAYGKGTLGATVGKDVGATGTTYTFYQILKDALGEEEAKKLLKFENESYTTFKDYGSHNFKFYYMERGAGSGVCRMNFNFPVIPKNSIAVGKELNLGEAAGALGDPSFEFQVLKEGATGKDLPNDLFIAPGETFEIYRDGVKTGRTGTVDENGVIRLKAGEMAVFPDVDSGKGRYFVRELLDVRIFEQYGAVITIDGTVGSGDSLTDTTVDGRPFKGADSPVKNIDDGSVTMFQFVNNVEISKLGSLSVTKKVAASKDEWQSAFAFEIMLDGTPLPVGTKYMVGSEERTVETEGVITLAPEETAVIDNILAGSRYTVKETAASAAGYDVSYSAEPEGNGGVMTEDGQTFIQGIISHRGEAQASVTVVNAKDAYGSLVIEKRIADNKEAYIEGETFSYRVYLENFASGRLESYNGPYYLKDAEEYYYTPAGKTEVKDIQLAEPFGEASGGVIPDVSPKLRIEIINILAGSGFYAEEITESLPDKYGEPEKELVDGTYEKAEAVTDADNTVTADGALKKDTTAQIVITNKLLSWQIVKRSASSAELFLKDAEFELVKEGETEASYRGTSGEDGSVEWKNTAGEAVSIYDIEEGVYRMNEVKAPVGYVISEIYWKLTFKAKGAVPEITCIKKEAPEAEVKVTPERTPDPAEGSQITFYFDNAVIYQLPNAGGPGIYWYLIGGTLLMAASALILYKKPVRAKQ